MRTTSRMAQPADMPVAAGSLLRSFRSELGPTFWDRRFVGGDDRFDLLEIRAAASFGPAPEGPDALAAAEQYAREDITRTSLLELSEQSHINGRKLDLSRIDELFQAGATEIWEVPNAGGPEQLPTSTVRASPCSRARPATGRRADVSSHGSLVRR